MALACFMRQCREVSTLDREWLSFRDRYGVVWSQRSREQFNRAVANVGWPITLSWHGFEAAPERPSPPMEEVLALLCAVLKCSSGRRRRTISCRRRRACRPCCPCRRFSSWSHPVGSNRNYDWPPLPSDISSESPAATPTRIVRRPVEGFLWLGGFKWSSVAHPARMSNIATIRPSPFHNLRMGQLPP